MKNLLYLLTVSLFISCSTEPEPIAYGHDACDFCEMTIVDRSYAARAVSTKGKQFKYDAIECMVHHQNDHPASMAIQQVANFSNPSKMIPVEEAIFIVNDSLNSPMGANLAAVKMDSHLASPQSADTFFWDDLILHLMERDSLFDEEQ